MKTLKRLVFLASVTAASLPAGQAISQQAGGQMPPPAVTVVTLHAQDVTLTASLPGRVLPTAEAEVRPQVSGIITERLFEEGSTVAEGDPLYKIDPRSYEASVAQAEAGLAQAQAQADAARREAARVDTLRDRKVASEQTKDDAVAKRDAAEAAVKVAEAQVLQARINLDYTTITAPLDGVIGLAQASAGALVTANQATPLAVIRKIDPVRVDVTQSAAEILRWQRQGAEAALPKDVDRTVTLKLADGSIYEHTGQLTAAEPHVDETTGVVTLRMEFANPDSFLLPGMYVLAEIPQARMQDAILAPQEGVSRDRRGRPVAMVVNAQNMVEERQLVVVQDHGNAWVVREGLADGDRIIVQGLQKIAVGVPVTPEELQDPAAAPAGGEKPAGDAPAGEAPAGDKAGAAGEAGDQPAADAGAAAAETKTKTE